MTQLPAAKHKEILNYIGRQSNRFADVIVRDALYAASQIPDAQRHAETAALVTKLADAIHAAITSAESGMKEVGPSRGIP